MSKIGLHSVIGPKTGVGQFLQNIADHGQTLAVVKCVDDMSLGRLAKQYNRNTLTVGRFNTLGGYDMQAWKPADWGTARNAALHYFSVVLPYWSMHPYIDVWETFNEFSSRWEWQGEFYLWMMEHADREGFKLAHYACSTGNPPESVRPELVECLQETKRRGHYLSLHEYGGVPPGGVTDWPETLKGTQPFHALRWIALLAFLELHDADPMTIISECGQSGGSEFIGMELFVADLAWYDAWLMRDKRIVGAAAWTLGCWQGCASNFQEALPALAEYIITHPQPGPLPYRAYLPVIGRDVAGAEAVSLADVLVALSLGAAAAGGAWLLNRRMKARRRI